MGFTVSSGQTVSGQKLSGMPGTIYDVGSVFSGGTAVHTRVLVRAELIVDSGGLARLTAVSQGGIEYLGSMSLKDTIEGGAHQEVYAGGSAVSTSILGGQQVVMSGGYAAFTSLGGGSEIVDAGGFVSDTKGAFTLVVEAGASASVVDGGIVSVFGTATSLAPDGLVVEGGGSVTDVVGSANARIEVVGSLTDAGWISGSATSVSLQGGLLAVEIGGVGNAVTLGASGQVSGGTAFDEGSMSGVSVGGSMVKLSADAHGGTDVTLVASAG